MVYNFIFEFQYMLLHNEFSGKIVEKLEHEGSFLTMEIAV